MQQFEPQKIKFFENDLTKLSSEAFGYKRRKEYVLAGGPTESIENSLALAGQTMNLDAGYFKKKNSNNFELTLDSWIYFFELPDPSPEPWVYIGIGRACNNKIVIPQSYKDVSGGHAILKRCCGQDDVYLIDMSRFHTYLNGEKLNKNSQSKINDGDLISLAQRIKLMFLKPESLHQKVRDLFQ